MGLYVGDKAVKKILNGDNAEINHVSTKDKGVYPKTASETVTFNYTGADQHWTAPESGKLTIECWGAGAGGSAGGYAKGTISVSGGDKFSIVCGARGNGGGRYGFAGASNYSNSFDGGGLSGVFTGDAAVADTDAARALVIGGGAGGNGAYGAGGAGGGETGGNGGAGGGCGSPGYGGTQTAKGGGGAQVGGQFHGSNGSGTYGSGGGGGWFGGGGTSGDGSRWDDQSAGGGSGYVIASATDRILTQGGGAATGTNGKVVLTFVCEPKVPSATYVTQAGAYHNPDLGLISISSDGENWITMSDKDVGAQDVLEAGKTFQYGNAYGFPGAGDSSQITTDATTPDLTGYEGGNLYSNDHYRTNADWNAANRNLWKGIAFTNLKSLEKGPCPIGFHIPSLAEIQAAMQAAGSIAGDGTNVTYEVLNQYLLFSHYSSRQGNGEFYPKTTYYLTNEYVNNQSQNRIKALRIYGNEGSETIGIVSAYMNYGGYIRPFRDKAMIPTTEWTRLSPGGNARLPHEYQEVEYIESSGTQYISTGYAPTQNTEFEIEYEITSYNARYGVPMGTRYEHNNQAYYFGYENNDNSYYGFGNNKADPSSVAFHGVGVRRNITYHNGVLSNGTQSVAVTTNQTPYGTIRVFGEEQQGSVQELGCMKLYKFKLREGETLTRDYVPCYRVSDGAIGLYDLVEGKFYTNSGTGTFKKGASVNIWQMPSGYTELQYIQSSGASNTDGQYVDTGYMPNNNTEFELSMSNWSNASGSFQLFGQDTSWTTGDQGTSVVTDNYSWNGPNANTFTHGFRDGNFHLLLLNNSGLYRDGTLVHNGRAGQTFQSSITCAIFCLHRGTTYTERSSYRFHYMRIRENGNIKRDYVPCIRDSDGVLGLYDLITNTFLANQGTGSFVAGPVVFRDGFKVSSNTMLYTPMDTDLFDHSLNERSITNVGITLDTSILQNKGVGYFRGNVDYGLQFTGAEFGNNDFTISWREKTLQNSTGAGSRFSSAWDASSWCGVLVGYNHTYLYAGTGGSSRNIVNGSQIFNSTPNTRVHRVLVKEGSNWKTYRNNVLFGSASGSGSVGYNISVIGNYRPGDKNPFHGYMSDFILEKKAWTDQQREDYFNATKALYGVS